MVAVRALSFATKLGFLKFILEEELELIIKALQSKEDSLAPFGHILEVAKITTDVNPVSYTHVHRLGNVVAHNLAKHAWHVAGLQVWMEDVPPHLCSLCGTFGFAEISWKWAKKITQYRRWIQLPNKPYSTVNDQATCNELRGLTYHQTELHDPPPPDGCVKINFDGATFNDINKAGLGVVIRDRFGQLLALLLE